MERNSELFIKNRINFKMTSCCVISPCKIDPKKVVLLTSHFVIEILAKSFMFAVSFQEQFSGNFE